MFAKSLMVLGLALLPAGSFDFGFGRGLLAIKDQDGDGLEELLIVDQTHRDGFPAQFYVWSPGADRCLQNFNHGRHMDDGTDSLVAVQGIDDADAVYIGFNSTGAYLVLFSTLDGTELRRFHLEGCSLGWISAAIWNMGDVDGIPGDEVLVSYKADQDELEGNSWYREAIILSLEKGDIPRVEHGDYFGVVSDIDEDGVPEYIVSRDMGRRVCNGRTGESLFVLDSKLDGDPALGGFGYHPTADLDDDGTADILEFMSGEGVAGRDPHYAEMRALSGTNGDLLWTSERLGCTGYTDSSVAMVDDHDEDGTPDIVLSNALGLNRDSGCPDWRILSGSSGVVLARFKWREPEHKGQVTWARGTGMALMGDLDGDGHRDVAISHTKPRHRGYGDGFVGLYSTKKGLIRTIWREDVELDPAIEESSESDD